MKFIFAASLLLSTSLRFASQAQSAPGPATETIKFKTSAVCDMCKTRLEKSLAYEKGVQRATLDVPSKIMTVTYRTDKTTPTALRAAIQKTGYDADEQPAEARAYGRLPECCQKTSKMHQD